MPKVVCKVFASQAQMALGGINLREVPDPGQHKQAGGGDCVTFENAPEPQQTNLCMRLGVVSRPHVLGLWKHPHNTHTRPVSSEHPCMRALETPLEGYSELCASSPAPGVEVGRTCDANCSRHSNTDLRQAGADVWECLQSLISDFGF